VAELQQKMLIYILGLIQLVKIMMLIFMVMGKIGLIKIEVRV
jgi:hypothetical protein